ncbi:MAG: hypothetical protein LBS99_07350 [Clostridiales bacterium]|jgi:hypothetical protein|nr:hypothetical protein [Clostridiales bacterium]
MTVSGEAMPFVEALDFNSKRQLLDRLNGIKKSAAGLPEPDRTIVGEMTAASIEEIADCDERELLAYKRYLARRGKK